MSSQDAHSQPHIAVIGGGAAGYFGAIAAAEAGARVVIFEAGSRPLAKVRISGGGRCNVTAHTFDPRELVRHYPRGSRELLGPVTRFGARQTWEWFEQRGVPLKVESDGRVFPVSDSSEDITGCLEQAADRAGITQLTRATIRHIDRREDGSFQIAGAETEVFTRILLATGSGQAGYDLAASLGHTIVPCVPSLFSFAVADARIARLAGISVPATRLRLAIAKHKPIEYDGPLLITHWGLSGPAVLRLSAWGARDLAAVNYRATLTINWLPDLTREPLIRQLLERRNRAGARGIAADSLFGLPMRLWSRLTHVAGIPDDATWSALSRTGADRLADELLAGTFRISGRGEFKDEFVTAGGVSLKEIDFRTMQSRVCSGLYLAGEILDIDGITGGYNLQSAWTTGYIAGLAMSAP